MSDKVHALHIPNVILTYIYIAFIIFCFLLSMGNRPAGSKWQFILSMIVFALMTLYMTAAAIYLAVSSIITAENDSDGAKELLTDPIFVNIVISIAATFGIWLLASLLYVSSVEQPHGSPVQTSGRLINSTFSIILHLVSEHHQLEPYHMFTSIIQYLLMAPRLVTAGSRLDYRLKELICEPIFQPFPP